MDGQAAMEQAMDSPLSVLSDGSGRFFLVSAIHNRVYLITADGTIRVAAGTGAPGSDGDGGPAAQAQLNFPSAVALDADGNLYIADTGNHVVRKVSPDGNIQTIAGSRVEGFKGDGGPAPAAMLNRPSGIAVDSKGVVYIADTGNFRIRKITTKGVISTFAGDGERRLAGDGRSGKDARFNDPLGLAVDAGNNLYVADSGNARIRVITPSGKVSTCVCGSQTSFLRPEGIAIANDGTIYVADSGGNRVRKITPKGTLVAFAGTGAPGFNGDAGPAVSALLKSPRGLSVDKTGAVYIADTGNHRIRRIDAKGVITTVTGNGQALRGAIQSNYPTTTSAIVPAAPIPLSADKFAANCLVCPAPSYPQQARRQRITDTVVLSAIVGKDGRVRDVRVIRGNEVLAKAAVDTVRNWRYRPQIVDGEPVEVTASISIAFIFK
jgi:TonB family protein